MGIHNLLQKHRETNNIERRPSSGRPTKMTAPVKALVEQMRDDDETTAVQLYALLLRHGHTMTVLRCRAALGWTLRGSAYCQLIRQQNKVKRLQWAQEHLSDGFDNVIWTDTKRASGAATGRESFFIVLFGDESFCDCFITVCPFRLNGWGVLYNGKGCSVFVSFRKNGTITLYIVSYCTYICDKGETKYAFKGVGTHQTNGFLE